MTDKLKSLEELSAHPALLKGLAVAQAVNGTSTPAAAEDAPVAATEPPIARQQTNPTALLPAYRFDYVNYRGEISTREVIPRYIYFGANQFHTEPQWLLKAYDPFKADERDFAMADMYPPSFIDKVTDALEATAAYQDNLNATLMEYQNQGVQLTVASENGETLRQIMVRRVKSVSKHFGFV